MKVSDLIKHLQSLPDDIPVWWGCSCCFGTCCRELQNEDVLVSTVRDVHTDEEYPAVIVGDDVG